jgi:hypothetical protein
VQATDVTRLLRRLFGKLVDELCAEFSEEVERAYMEEITFARISEKVRLCEVMEVDYKRIRMGA